MVASHVASSGNLAHNPGMCPDWESNQQPFGSQVGTQSTEPHHPGLNSLSYNANTILVAVALFPKPLQKNYSKKGGDIL